MRPDTEANQPKGGKGKPAQRQARPTTRRPDTQVTPTPTKQKTADQQRKSHQGKVCKGAENISVEWEMGQTTST